MSGRDPKQIFKKKRKEKFIDQAWLYLQKKSQSCIRNLITEECEVKNGSNENLGGVRTIAEPATKESE